MLILGVSFENYILIENYYFSNNLLQKVPFVVIKAVLKIYPVSDR